MDDDDAILGIKSQFAQHRIVVHGPALLMYYSESAVPILAISSAMARLASYNCASTSSDHPPIANVFSRILYHRCVAMRYWSGVYREFGIGKGRSKRVPSSNRLTFARTSGKIKT